MSTPSMPPTPHRSPFNIIVIVAALGYFVDIFDLLLFGIVRTDSLRSFGLTPDEVKSYGFQLAELQMAGLLVGGLLWGVVGDRRGRRAVLFGSIILYSLANIANGFVTDVEGYSVCRVLAGLGLAGELGAGITLVSETMHRDQRGWGTTLVASFGVLGAVVASLIGSVFAWRTAYFIGGGLGLLLLFLRVSTYESGMFVGAKTTAHRGHFHRLFSTRERAIRYLACIGIGLPIWYAIGLFILFASEFSKALGVTPLATNADAILWAYVGLAAGDLSSGYLSQRLKSRRSAVLIFLVSLVAAVGAYLLAAGVSQSVFYLLCALVGFAAGYWALLVTIASEQFGTNLRATATTTVPNFARGAAIPVYAAYKALEPAFGAAGSAAIVGAGCFTLAFASLWVLRETFGKELDYVEVD